MVPVCQKTSEAPGDEIGVKAMSNECLCTTYDLKMYNVAPATENSLSTLPDDAAILRNVLASFQGRGRASPDLAEHVSGRMSLSTGHIKYAFVFTHDRL